MQDLNDMLYFAEVVERGGFAAAGRALGLPKSRLSRRVAELESRLGARLLQRTTRKLSLTEVGEIYLRHCSAMRDEALAASEAVAQMQVEPRGTLRITCPVTLAQSTVGYLVPRYMALHPHVKVDMRVTNRVIDLVEEGIDIALRVRPTLEDSGSLIVKNLGAGSGRLRRFAHGLAVAQIRLAHLGQRELARGALQQPHAQLRFQIRHAPREARLGDAQRPPGGGEAAPLHHFGEIQHVVEVLHGESVL